MTDYQLSAVPLFIFMAAMLEKAGIIEELFDAVYKWLGSVKGGLAAATVLACTALAAMVGVVGATEVTMGMIALPAMLKRGYDQKLACGSLLAGGTLGILIPPSVMAIVYAVVAQQSLGELLVGSIFPGFLLSGLYIAYILIRCYINPSLGPALPLEERVSTREKFALLRKTIAPLLLIVLVLGVIFVGIATPVEAAGIGTFGALFVSALHRRLNWLAVQEAAIATLKATAMVMWIFFGATMFVGFFIVKGGQTFVANTILGTGLPPYGILMLMMVILFVLGMFIDWVGILLLTVPIFLPIMKSLEWPGLFGLPGVRTEDVPLWYGVIFMVNMQMAFLSPPFGYSLFYLKSVAPPEITMATIFRAAVQFMALQWLGVGLCILFPAIVTWLPSILYAR
jgi:tripartite ATP-independent transporter DctM subunit